MRKISSFVLLLLLTALFPATVIKADPPVVDGCQIFPESNPWNTDISNAPVHPNSANYIANILANGGDYVHPDFGETIEYGIPWITVDSTQPLVPVTFDYEDESEPGLPGQPGYPFPANAPIEGGGDRHVLAIRTSDCMLFETWASEYNSSNNSWHAGSGAIFDLNSNDLRPDGWTSADAAGLPIMPGLARCTEIQQFGAINHALRFTVSRTQRAYVYPATHYASSYTDPNYPPMGLRLRLKANYDISGLTGQALIIAQTLKKYGMILADNGSNWYISGEMDLANCWNDDELNQLKDIHGSAFEVIVSPPPPNDDPENLLGNADFEGADTRKTPQSWTILNRSGEKRVCNSISATNPEWNILVSYSGQCAMKFKGRVGERGALNQIIKSVVGAPAGTVFNVSGYVKANNLPANSARFRAVITYTNGVKEKLGNDFFPAGTYDYTPVSTTFTTGGVIQKMRFRVTFAGTSGTFWVDDASLKTAGSSSSWLPLPVAP